MKNSLSVAIAATLILAAASAQAEVRVSGFGQVVAGATTGEGERFPQSAYTDEVSFKEESLFAVQVDSALNDRVSVTGQVLARGHEDFDAELAWAYANVTLGKGWSMKAGRQRTPFYRYSDFLDVGYAYPWIRTPVSMYNQPWSNNDGISFTHTGYFGDWYSQLQLVYGEFDGDARFDGQNYDARLANIAGFAWDGEYNEWLSLRAAYLQGDLTVAGTSMDDLAAALQAYGQPGLAAELDYNEDKGSFANVGFKVDRANWLVVGEYAITRMEDTAMAGNDRADWYLSAGRRFGNVMPHLTWGRRDADVRTDLLSALPPEHPLYGPLASAAAAEQLDESFVGLGVRWDFATNVAFKADWTRYDSRIAEHGDADMVSTGLVFTF